MKSGVATMCKKYIAIDLAGKKFGKLTVIKKSHKDKRGEWYWLCKCDCGNLKTVSGFKLRSGNTKSCGCLQKEIRESGVLRRTHGMTNSRLYYEWNNMRGRCKNPKNIMYHAYGERGISVCHEWDASFDSFMKWAISNGYRDDLTLDRIDVNGNYCPENCRWITSKEQCLNTTRNHLITAFGRTQTIKEWSDETGIKYDTIERRINQYGWCGEDAVSVPPWGKKKRL